MSALPVLKLVRDVRSAAELPAVINADPWATATEGQRRTADMRATLIAPLAELVRGGASINNVCKLFIAQTFGEVTSPTAKHALHVLGAKGASFSTLKRWVSAFLADGKAGLLPRHTGRVRQARGWEERAVELYNTPSKPGFADVAWRLRSEGFADATESRVKRYLKALPATLGDKSPARLGAGLHRLTRRKFQRRHLDEVLVGEIYAGDGHTIDCYLAHPNTGKLWRPELTCYIDLKSRYIPGWWFSEKESSQSTLFALSNAMVQHDHVPAWLYIDRGAGYRAKMLSDENTGWYGKFDIETIGALPGNPHGKGWIERFFRTVRDKHDKFFDGGQWYCGDDMAPEVNRRLHVEVDRGTRKLRSLYDYVDSFRRFIDAYHNTPMDVLGGRTPAQVWAELTPVPVGLDVDAVMRPSQQATVQRQTVRLHNRTYYHEALALYDGQRVVVDYDLHKDGKAWVHDLKGRFVCEAKLTATIGVLPTSRLEEQRDRREAGQLKRLEKKAAEVRARRQDAITVDDQVRGLEDLGADLLPATTPPAAPAPALPPIDITDWKG